MCLDWSCGVLHLVVFPLYMIHEYRSFVSENNRVSGDSDEMLNIELLTFTLFQKCSRARVYVSDVDVFKTSHLHLPPNQLRKPMRNEELLNQPTRPELL
jgi:hypothetical protein